VPFEASSFTISSPKIVRRLETPVVISSEAISFEQVHNNSIDTSRFKAVTAIWDTGATSSVISLDIARHLNLVPRDSVTISHAAGRQQCSVYVIDVALHHGVQIPKLQVIASDLGNSMMLIGMDIISNGDFAFTNANNRSVFSYRTPPLNHIDFEKN
jgi:hypothetical protein